MPPAWTWPLAPAALAWRREHVSLPCVGATKGPGICPAPGRSFRPAPRAPLVNRPLRNISTSCGPWPGGGLRPPLPPGKGHRCAATLSHCLLAADDELASTSCRHHAGKSGRVGRSPDHGAMRCNGVARPVVITTIWLPAAHQPVTETGRCGAYP
jgi:hypothetical protein